MMQTGTANATAAKEPPASSDNIVEVRGITKFYGTDVHALDSVDLAFPTGQMTTLLGPSGCGKTTLLKIIAGLLEPTAGTIRVDTLRSQAEGFLLGSSERTELLR